MEPPTQLPGLVFRVRGRWAQFRKPETNNNPLTHDFITKTALVGLIGAVLGKDRDEMRPFFPLLTSTLLYGVQINTVVKKESWAFTLRDATRPNAPDGKAPRQMEFLRDPDFTVAVALTGEQTGEVQKVFNQFAQAVRQSEACYTPVLGLHNCPAELEWIEEGAFIPADGSYSTKGFYLRSQRLDRASFSIEKFRLGFERVPTFQDNNWWNPPNRYVEVAYPSNGVPVSVVGSHYRFSNDEEWCLI